MLMCGVACRLHNVYVHDRGRGALWLEVARNRLTQHADAGRDGGIEAVVLQRPVFHEPGGSSHVSPPPLPGGVFHPKRVDATLDAQTRCCDQVAQIPRYLATELVVCQIAAAATTRRLTLPAPLATMNTRRGGRTTSAC